MKQHSIHLIGLVLIAVLSSNGLHAEASPWDLNVKRTVAPGTNIDIIIEFTKDGVTISSSTRQLTNGTNAPLTRTVTATAPSGTNDREYSETRSLIVAAAESFLPSGQGVADYGDFLATHGFTGASALDSPLVLGSQSQSIFTSINNVNLFATVANQSNFPLGSTLTTNASGQVSALPGIQFFTDDSHTIPYANNQLLVVGIISESAVPEPSTYLLLLSGLVGLALRYVWRPRVRGPHNT